LNQRPPGTRPAPHTPRVRAALTTGPTRARLVRIGAFGLSGPLRRDVTVRRVALPAAPAVRLRPSHRPVRDGPYIDRSPGRGTAPRRVARPAGRDER